LKITVGMKTLALVLLLLLGELEIVRNFRLARAASYHETSDLRLTGAGTGLTALERNSLLTETEENFFFVAAASGGVDVRDDGVGIRPGTALATAATEAKVEVAAAAWWSGFGEDVAIDVVVVAFGIVASVVGCVAAPAAASASTSAVPLPLPLGAAEDMGRPSSAAPTPDGASLRDLGSCSVEVRS
jgi:hypothetical protein